jgi:hypothetical protein
MIIKIFDRGCLDSGLDGDFFCDPDPNFCSCPITLKSVGEPRNDAKLTPPASVRNRGRDKWRRIFGSFDAATQTNRFFINCPNLQTGWSGPGLCNFRPPTCHPPMHEGEQSASYSSSSLRTIRWFPELPAGEHSIFLRYNTGCRQKLCPPPALSSPVS